MSLKFRRVCLVSAVVVGLASFAAPRDGLTQTSLRSSFPGRRVGGGTRGECSSRVLAHLVPGNSVFAPGSDKLLGLVQGPSRQPVSLTITFKPQQGGLDISRTLPASAAGLTLVRGSVVTAPTIWESAFDCGSGDAGSSGDPLSFVQTVSPPAVSLLLTESDPSDEPVLSELQALQGRCGSTVPAQATLAKFGLAELMTSEWPEQLPVRCPS